MHLEFMRDSAREFPLPEDPSSVGSMTIWHCKYRSLSCLSRFPNLRVLVIASYPDSSFAPLAKLSRLKYLRIVHFPRVGKLDELQHLADLEVLSLSSLPSWDASGKVLTVETLRPLAKLHSLRHIELFGVRPAADGLAPLYGLERLRSARFSRIEPAETQEFYSRLGVTDDFVPAPE